VVAYALIAVTNFLISSAELYIEGVTLMQPCLPNERPTVNILYCSYKYDVVSATVLLRIRKDAMAQDKVLSAGTTTSTLAKSFRNAFQEL